MIDNLAILISHVLLAIAFWRLTQRADLDQEPPRLGHDDMPPPPAVSRRLRRAGPRRRA